MSAQMRQNVYVYETVAFVSCLGDTLDIEAFVVIIAASMPSLGQLQGIVRMFRSDNGVTPPVIAALVLVFNPSVGFKDHSQMRERNAVMSRARNVLFRVTVFVILVIYCRVGATPRAFNPSLECVICGFASVGPPLGASSR